MKKNLVQARSFREMLEKTIRKYTPRTLEAAEVIEELITIAKTMREERDRGKHLNFSEEEIAFYDALGVNDRAVKILGDKSLRQIAIDLTKTIRQTVTLEWALRESVPARLRVLVKKVLRRRSQRRQR